MSPKKVKIIECPRDAMQGWHDFIPTEQKVEYLNELLKVGFHTLDFGSFVSPKAIPQLADTKEVVPQLDMSNTDTNLLAIIANERGAEDAVVYDEISYLGFPFSISETFQQQNTNSSIAESLKRVERIQKMCIANSKKMVIYISMGFGNPYDDPYSAQVAIDWVRKLSELGIGIFSMSDTVGVSNPENIEYIFSNLTKEFKNLEFGAHFHSTSETRKEKLQAALDNSCYRFDSALLGIGGCPLAQDELVGNMATETLMEFLDENEIEVTMDNEAYGEAMRMADEIFYED